MREPVTPSRPNMRCQCDHNAGLTGGLLVSVMHEPFDFPGNWELFTSARLDAPDGVRRSAAWMPRSLRHALQNVSESCSTAGPAAG